MTKNTYDKNDMIRREAVLIAGPLKIAAYRACDPETLEWSSLQIHMTYDNTVMAVLSEAAAKLLNEFVQRHVLKPESLQPVDPDQARAHHDIGITGDWRDRLKTEEGYNG